MLKNNLKLTYRDFKRNKLYSFIKVGGLALGIAACFLIALYIRHELSYDKYYKDGNRIFRVVQVQNINGEIVKSTVLQAPLMEVMKKEFPEVENAGRIFYFGAGTDRIRRSDRKDYFNESGIAYVDQSILDIFKFPVIDGDLTHALDQPNTVVISKRIAEKFFPNEEAVGKSFVVDNDVQNPYKITAVIKNFPDNSHMRFDFLMALNLANAAQQNWNFNSFHNYVLLKPGTNVIALQDKLKTIITKYIIPFDKKQGQFFYDRTKDGYELQAVKDIHLKSAGISQNASFDFADVGDIRIDWVLGISALFILLLACINFINLSTAKSTKRAKEIGFKRTIGAQRGTIIRQLFGESVLYSAVSIILATGLTVLLLPYFDHLAGRSLTIPWKEWWLIPLLASVTLIIGGLAGIYPSVYLTSFNTVKTLKGNLAENRRTVNLRSGMVVFQFAASIVLIVCTLVVFKQMNYILNKDLGFNKEQVIVLQGGSTLGSEVSSFKDDLKSVAGVKSVSISSYLPVENSMRNGTPFYKEGMKGIDPGITCQDWVVDDDYIKTMGLKIIKGRDFSEKISSDQRAAIINQKLARQLNLVNPVGALITDGNGSFTVIGVVKDFNYDNMRYPIRPLVMRNGLSSDFVSIKVNTSDMHGMISTITKLWNNVSPDQSISYSFLDEEYAGMYISVQRMGTIFRSFALLAIIVACLGLFGLAEFMTKQRIKEIGVRKVNGAKVAGILSLLNKEFVKWVIIAFAIACPVAWYAMQRWLENFAYKTTFSWWIFALAILLTLGIALLTVSVQSWKAATRNPVESLRYE